MGTYYTWGASKRDIVKDRIKPFDNDQGHYEVVHHCCRGNCLWKLSSFTFQDSGRVKRWIELDLLTVGGAGGDGWGYKPMDEDMWPYYYSCPIGYLKAADPPETDNAREWRQRVIQYHQDRRSARQ